MKNFFTKKRTIIATLALALIGAGGLFLGLTPTRATSDVHVESTLRVGNHTQGITDRTSVNARVDDVVNITAWYHNIEEENSGRIAENVNVRINIPGSMTNVHQVTSRVDGSNTAPIDNIATINSSIPTNLTFIPGTATRRFNAGTNENPNWVIQSIPDSVVTTGYTIPRVRPCWNFQETINVQARVSAPVVSITKEVKVEGAPTWATTINADPGATLAYLITIRNEGNERLSNVIVRDSLPPQLDFVEGSARLINANYPNGFTLSDRLIDSGVNIGNYGTGSGAYIRFNARIPNDLAQCGDYRFTNVAAVRADQLGEFYNTAIVNTTRDCAVTEGVNLRVVKFHDINGNRIEDSGEERLGGWRFNITGPNGLNISTITDANGIATVTGDLRPGRYTVTEVLQSGWINTTGLTIARDVTTDRATQTFVFGNRRTEAPIVTQQDTQQLPATGPLQAIAMTLGAIGLSGSALAWIKSRKRFLNSFRK